MGLLQDWGGKVANEGKTAWKSGKHWIEQTWGDAGDFIDRKTPEFRLDVKADIDAKVQIDKDNFNVRMDSQDIEDAGEKLGNALSTGLQGLGTSIGNSLEGFGDSLNEGLGKLGEELGTNIQAGLGQLGDNVNSAAAQLTAGITSHGSSLENAVVEFGRVIAGATLHATQGLQAGFAILGKSLENIDATGGLGRYLVNAAQYSQAAGQKLLALDQYFGRITGENSYDSYLLKVRNTSDKSFPGFQFLTHVKVQGLGGTDFQQLSLSGTPSSGNFRLSFAGSTTGNIPWNASPMTVKAALEGLPSVGAGNVECFGDDLVTIENNSGTRRTINGVIEIVFTGALSSVHQPPITFSNVTLNNGAVPRIEVYQQSTSSKQYSLITGGDPSNEDFLTGEASATLNLGAFRREFGVPFIERVWTELLPSTDRVRASDLLLTLEDISSGVNRRRKAADGLSELGPFAAELLPRIYAVTQLPDDQAPPIVRAAASDAYHNIKSFGIDATASIVVSSGDFLEPLSLLRSSKVSPNPFVPPVFAAAAIPQNRIVATLDNKSPLFPSTSTRGITVTPVNDADIAEAELITKRFPTVDSKANEMLQATSGLLTLQQSTITSFQSAVDQARILGESMKRLIPPAPFYIYTPPQGLYGIVMNMLEPTFKHIREAIDLMRELEPHFTSRLAFYQKRRLHDPSLTHLVGVQSLDEITAGDGFIVHAAIEIRDNSTGTTVASEMYSAMPARQGEWLFPIPLRFVDSDPKTISISVTTHDPANYDPHNLPGSALATRVIVTHYSGLLGQFQAHGQVISSGQVTSAIEFRVLRMFTR